jgi:hypothetical protein
LRDRGTLQERGRKVLLPSIYVDEEIAEVVRSFDQARDDEVLEHFVRPFAEQFIVSPIAMRIRLERLELLHREVPRQRSLLVRS